SYIQKDGDNVPSERNWLRDETGGSIYLRLSTRPIEQPQRPMTPELRQAIVDGAYWLRRPGPNAQVVVAYTGAVAPEAIEAVGVEHFGQTGSIADLYRHYGIDSNSIVAAAQTIAPGRPMRHLRALAP